MVNQSARTQTAYTAVPMGEANEELVRTFKANDLRGFLSALRNGANPDYEFEESTCLLLACQQSNREQYIKALLDADADPNLMKPILHASVANNYRAIKLLVKCNKTNVNVTFVNQRSILHTLCIEKCTRKTKSSVLECIFLLMNRPDTEVNKPDDGACSPIMLAVENFNEEQVEEMLHPSVHVLNLDLKIMVSGQTARDMIVVRFPKLRYLLPAEELRQDMNSSDPQERLLAALQHGDLEVFRQIISEKDSRGHPVVNAYYFYEDPYYLTCMELACRMGAHEGFVVALCEAGVAVKDCRRVHGIPLVHFVVNACCPETLKFLLTDDKVDIREKDLNDHTVLHVAAERRCSSREEFMLLQECVYLILDKFIHPTSRSIIDKQDAEADTALHDAAKYGNTMMTLTLLRHGANIMIKNKDNKPPLSFIDCKTFHKFLDEQVFNNGYAPLHPQYTLIFNYEFLASPTLTDDTNEMEPLKTVSESHLRELLTHPVLNSFIDLKWKLLQPYFMINASFYIIFVLLLTMYVLFTLQDRTKSHYITPTNSSEEVILRARTYHNFIVVPYLIFLSCLGLREIIQMITSKLKYWKRFDNYLDLTIVGIGFSIPFISGKIHTYLSIIIILSAWGELILLTGSFPQFSLQLEMLKKVMLTFLRYMAWYSLLIIPFAISFQILFWHLLTTDDNLLGILGESILRTTVMVTGEFNVSDLDFDSFPILAHIVLLLFVIAIAIVLLNLLNGLAVSDTQLIKDKAKILSLQTMVQVLYYLEEQLHAVVKVPGVSAAILRISRIHLFPKTYKRIIHVFGDSGKVKFFDKLDDESNFSTLRMHCDIIAEANELTSREQVNGRLDAIRPISTILNDGARFESTA